MQKVKTIHIRYVPEDEDGKPLLDEVFEGDFRVRKLTVLDTAQVRTRTAQLCGGMYCVRKDGESTGQGVSGETEFRAYVIALLESAIEDGPPDWSVKEIYDEGLLMHIFGEVSKFALNFREGGRKRDSSAAGGAAGEVAGAHHGGGAGGGGAERPRAVEARDASTLVDP